MRRRIGRGWFTWGLVALTLAWLACDWQSVDAQMPTTVGLDETVWDGVCGPVRESQHRGMNFAHSHGGGYGTEESRQSLEDLTGIGFDAVTLIPFGWQSNATDTVIAMNTTGRGESDASLRATTAQAHALGMRVVMKPHLWLRGGAWRGNITFETAVDWDAWFASYTVFALHYAELSQELGIELFVIGVELSGTTRREPERWRTLIAAVRAVYTGQLVYAANWDEAATVPFWDALDYIGVQMFAPLAPASGASRAELVARANQHLATYRAVSETVGRPILLTEVGFMAMEATAVTPWVWPERGATATAAGDAAQTDAYCAILATFGRDDLVEGIYWWKWFSNPEHVDGPSGFSPRGKPVEVVLREAFRPAM